MVPVVPTPTANSINVHREQSRNQRVHLRDAEQMTDIDCLVFALSVLSEAKRYLTAEDYESLLHSVLSIHVARLADREIRDAFALAMDPLTQAIGSGRHGKLR
jgi:hypothetical protein